MAATFTVRTAATGLVALLLAIVVALVEMPAADAHPRNVDKQATATGTGGAVASLDPHASQAGIDILRRGGNAVDAAVATAAMLGVTRPYDGSIGGGGFMVVYSADTGEVTTIDARESAPAAMQPDAFIDPDTGAVIPFQERRVSGLGVGVPGLLRGWEVALEEFGTIPLHRLLQPAITVAQRGFTVDEEYARRTQQNLAVFRDFTSTTETFLVDGDAPEVGTTIRNRDLARTYKLIARHGSEVFYEGEIAEAIVDAVTDPPVTPGTDRNVRPGDMTLADLAGYQAPLRDPTVISYRGYDVYGMPPPTSGGSTIGEALNILEGFDLGALPREEALHYLIEAMALAFADRNAYLGDPDFIDIPLAGLLSEEYAAERRALIGDTALPKPVPAGDPWPYEAGATAATTTTAGGSTTHVTTSDRHGNVVSYTFTIEQIGGSGITVPGYGFLLNNELTDFNPSPPDHPNAPAGGKRPRSSMSPTIVLADGEPVVALGTPGGARIITTVYEVLVKHLDFGLDLPEAIAAPRLSNLNSTTTLAESTFLATPEATALEARGHAFGSTTAIGNVTGIAFLPDGRVQAAAEPERLTGGSAMVERPGR